MSAYAMVVVIEAPDEETARQGLDRATIGTAIEDCVPFIGEPWEVTPANADALAAGELLHETGDERLRTVADFSPEYDTLGCFDQHPERAL